MIRLAALASTALVAMTAPALADPFSLTALIATTITAATSGAIAGTAATIAGTLIAGAITIGVGAALVALTTPSPPKPENGTVAVQQPLPFRIYGYGQARVPGAIMFKEQSQGYLGVVQALNAHAVDSFVGLYLNDDQVGIGFDPTGRLLSGVVQKMSDGRYDKNAVNISTRIGDGNPGVYTELRQLFSDTWPASALGKGIASLQMVCSPIKSQSFSTVFPYVEPKPSAVLRQYQVFDPRAAGQSPTDSSTWIFSDNPALCLLHFLCFSDYGSRRPYATSILPNLAAWVQAANDCDDPMPLKAGGTEKRYRLGGYTTTQQDRRSTIAAMLAACDGWMCERGDGTVDIKVGKYAAPTVTLTDDDILGYSIQRDVATKDKINRITARYTSPGNGYISVETVPMDDTTDQALRFGPPRALQMDLTWVQSTGQASRLQKREFIRQGRKTRGTLTLKLSGLNAAFERWVLINSNTVPRLSGVVVEPSRPVIDIARGRVTISIMSSGPDIDTYNPATDESPAPYVPQRPSTVGVPVPSNVSIVPEQTSSGTTTTVALLVSWDTPLLNGNAYTALSYMIQYRTSATGNAGAGPWIEQSVTDTINGARDSATLPSVPVGVELDVQVIAISSSGQLSNGSTIVQTSTAFVAPGSPVNLATAGSAGKVIVSANAPSDSDVASVQFFRGPSGAAFSACGPIGPAGGVTPGSYTAWTDQVGAGTYTYFATTIATTGVASTPAGPINGTAT